MSTMIFMRPAAATSARRPILSRRIASRIETDTTNPEVHCAGP
jgi:hypothetical protein